MRVKENFSSIKDYPSNVVQFIRKFTPEEIVSTKDIFIVSDSVYLITRPLKHTDSRLLRDSFSLGMFLGKVLSGRFVPSFQLLDILSKNTKNIVKVNPKAAWLFVCGRDVFSKGITEKPESIKPDDFVIVLNEHEECLGFGAFSDDKRMAVKRLLDRGDFLRREH